MLTEHPNANINSAYQPFKKHGSKGGGVWVTTEPLAFPVYGTTIGGKYGNAAARADALSTIKIEVPVSELPAMRAVQDPYGKNILRKGNDPRAIEPFPTWAHQVVPTTVFLDDMKPEWLKNIGYVEEASDIGSSATFSDLAEVPASWGLPPKVFSNPSVRGLSKGDFKEFVGYTGHRHGLSKYDKSQRRFIDDYLDNNQSIANRLPILPDSRDARISAYHQSADANVSDTPYNVMAKRYGDYPIAQTWSDEYRAYVKPGEDIAKARNRNFAPGAISRGIGRTQPITQRYQFDWDAYNDVINDGAPPQLAAAQAQPESKLNWDTIEYIDDLGYTPQASMPRLAFGAVSRGIENADGFIIDPVDIMRNSSNLDDLTLKELKFSHKQESALNKLPARQRAIRMNWLPIEEW